VDRGRHESKDDAGGGGHGQGTEKNDGAGEAPGAVGSHGEEPVAAGEMEDGGGGEQPRDETGESGGQELAHAGDAIDQSGGQEDGDEAGAGEDCHDLDGAAGGGKLSGRIKRIPARPRAGREAGRRWR